MAVPRHAQLADRRLYLLFTPKLCRGEPLAALEAALAGGVDLVQWRVKDGDRRAGLAAAAARCAAASVPLIVNDDPALAVAVDAAGAHLGQKDGDAAAARALLGRDRWLGVSTHDRAQIAAAARAGADYVGFGPCFPTRTKGYAAGLGAAALAEALAAAGDLPVFAIGGINAQNVGILVAAGCRRIAVSSAILSAGDPHAAAATLAELVAG